MRRSEDIHNELKMKAMNTRQDKLATKILYKIREKYYNEDVYINKGTDYEITAQPKKRKQITLVQYIEDIIFNEPSRCQWHNPTNIENWVGPNAIYK